MSDPAHALTSEADRLLGEYMQKIDHCVALLSRDQLWWRPNARCNSIGNLLLHLCGNLSQWVLGGLAGVPFERHRREEFSAIEGGTPAVLAGRLHDVVGECRTVVRRLTGEDLQGCHTIQGIERSGIGVLLHAVEHMGYHTGQIVYAAKQLVPGDVEIEFYPHLK